jgi:hypothetical protein
MVLINSKISSSISIGIPAKSLQLTRRGHYIMEPPSNQVTSIGVSMNLLQVTRRGQNILATGKLSSVSFIGVSRTSFLLTRYVTFFYMYVLIYVTSDEASW